MAEEASLDYTVTITISVSTLFAEKTDARCCKPDARRPRKRPHAGHGQRQRPPGPVFANLTVGARCGFMVSVGNFGALPRIFPATDMVPPVAARPAANRSAGLAAGPSRNTATWEDT